MTHPVPFNDKSSTHFAISGEKTKLPDIIILLKTVKHSYWDQTDKQLL